MFQVFKSNLPTKTIENQLPNSGNPLSCWDIFGAHIHWSRCELGQSLRALRIMTWPLIYRCFAKTQDKLNICDLYIIVSTLPKVLDILLFNWWRIMKVWKSITKRIRSKVLNIQEIFQTVIKFMLNNYAIIIYQNIQIYIYIYCT